LWKAMRERRRTMKRRAKKSKERQARSAKRHAIKKSDIRESNHNRDYPLRSLPKASRHGNYSRKTDYELRNWPKSSSRGETFVEDPNKLPWGRDFDNPRQDPNPPTPLISSWSPDTEEFPSVNKLRKAPPNRRPLPPPPRRPLAAMKSPRRSRPPQPRPGPLARRRPAPEAQDPPTPLISRWSPDTDDLQSPKLQEAPLTPIRLPQPRVVPLPWQGPPSRAPDWPLPTLPVLVSRPSRVLLSDGAGKRPTTSAGRKVRVASQRAELFF
jgi:hypothetical protein